MPEIKDFPNDVALVDSDVLPGQRADGTPLKATVARIKEAVNGAGGADITRNKITANVQVVGVAPAGSEDLNVFISMDGSGRLAHTLELWSGVPNKFASAANHAHLKLAVRNPAGPGLATAGERAQLLYNADADGKSALILHGYESEIGLTDIGNEASIDTTATSVGAAPSYIGTIKLRFTVSPALSLNQLVIFQVFSAVAGIQATLFGAKVTQIPTLVSGKYEVLLAVSGLDANHWNPAEAKDEPNLNANWVLRTLTQPEVASGAKVSLSRDTSGPTDQLTVVWSAAHNLTVGDNVSVWADTSLTGLTGLTTGSFNSGHVVEVVSSTSVKIRIRNFRFQFLWVFNGAAGATTQWFIYPGTRDPHHEPLPPSNSITAWRDTSGRVRRFAIGPSDVLPSADRSGAIGFDLPPVDVPNTIRIGWEKNFVDFADGMAARAGSALITAQTAGLVFEGSSLAEVRSVLVGQELGTGEVTLWARVRMPNAPTATGQFPMIVTVTEGTHRLMLYHNPVNQLILSVDNGSGANLDQNIMGDFMVRYAGKVVDLHLTRVGTTVVVYVNGTLVYTLTNAKCAAVFTTAAQLRCGGQSVGSAFVGRLHKLCVLNRALTATEVQALIDYDVAVDERLGSQVNMVANSGFEVDLAGWQLNNIGGSASLTRITSDKNAGAASAEFSGTVAGDSFLTNFATAPQGVRYRVKFWAKLVSGNANITVSRGNGTNGVPVTLTSSWAQYEVVSGAAAGNATNLIRWNLTAGTVFRIDDVEVYQLGTVVDLDCGVGAGFQIPDRSANRLHALAAGTVRHLNPTRSGQLRVRATATGQLAVAGQATSLIPGGFRITAITANVVGSGTVSLGTAALGTQVVNAASVAAGLNDLTVATRLFASNTSFFATLTGPTQVDFTISYDLID